MRSCRRRPTRRLRDGLIAYERGHGGWRGAVGRIDPERELGGAARGRAADPGRRDGRMAARDGAAQPIPDGAAIGFARTARPGASRSRRCAGRGRATMTAALGAVPAQRRRCRQAGRCRPGRAADGERQARHHEAARRSRQRGRAALYTLCQIPEVSGALVAMDPHTGRVLAMSGGFSFETSQFDRATQAKRQPGSSIKPFVYLTALDHGFTPVDPGRRRADLAAARARACRCGRRRNYNSNRFRGPTPLRVALEQSLNTVTARVADDGRDGADRARPSSASASWTTCRGVYSMALGAGETTPLRHTAAYAMLVNGGKRITPTLIDRVQDRNGADDLPRRPAALRRLRQTSIGSISRCRSSRTRASRSPIRARPSRSSTMLQGVVQRGTGTAVKAVGKPIAGKTGTTNDWQRRVVCRLHARSRRRRLCRLRRSGQPRRRRDRRAPRGADLPRLHDGGAEGRAGDRVPHPARHAARIGSARRPACRPAPASRRSTRPTSPAPSPARTAIAVCARASDERRDAARLDRRVQPARYRCRRRARAPAQRHRRPILRYRRSERL